MPPITPESAAPVCALCNGVASAWLEKRGYSHLRCLDCGSGFLSPEQIPEDLGALYGADYFEGKEDCGYPGYMRDAALSDRNFSRRLATIESHCPPGRLLEIGCAYGLFLKRAQTRGWDVSGVEIAEDCARDAAAACNAPVVAGDFLSAKLPENFDAVVMLDVIEHMPDPAACMARCAELLKPGGWLFLETGDLQSLWARSLGKRWHFIDPPQHLVYFSAASIERTLLNNGFKSVQVRKLGREVSLSNIVFKLFGKAAGPLLGIGGRLYLNFGDGMFVAAQRA